MYLERSEQDVQICEHFFEPSSAPRKWGEKMYLKINFDVGVLWRVAEGPISGSPQTINKLKSLGKKVFLMSNNSASSLEKYVTSCELMGMPIPKENIITPSAAVAYYLKEQNLENKKIFVLGTSHFMNYLREAGLHCSENG
ncbi:unnamed protein product, partial [Timema podura]|nr:unnamed protein product [Timema podura]